MLSEIEPVVRDAIANKKCPGAVVLVGQGDEVKYFEAFGDRAVDPAHVPMTKDTIFDMASLSKPMGCATSVMILVERGMIDVHEPVAKYLPEFGNHGKEKITVEQLLLHRGGLIADNSMKDYEHGVEAAWAAIMNSSPVNEPGTKFVYSDVGFIVLGHLVERVSGKPLDRFAHDEIFGPLKMTETSYGHKGAGRDRVAPTEKRDGEWIIGEVHDPRAHALGGVAGHAGVFSTAADTARWCEMMANGGELGGVRILKPETVRMMTTLHEFPDGTGGRGYGVDMTSSFASNRGDRFPKGTSFGHTGWTGTSAWIDPASKCYVIVLANRVHPDGSGDMKDVRHKVATIAAEALLGPATQPNK